MKKQTTTLRQSVYNALLNKIARRELAPGEIIVAGEIAEELGVSRTPVTEALHMLVAQGLVQGRANKCCKVAKYSSDEAWRLYEVRLGLESIAVRAMAERATDEEVAELKKIYKKILDATESGDISLATQYDFIFHQYIFNHCDNPFINSMTNANALLVMTKLMLARIEGVRAAKYGGLNWIAEAHLPILEAIETHNPDAAEAAVRQHIQHSIDDIREEASTTIFHTIHQPEHISAKE